ncbi:hypothetical protein [Methylobacter sp. S3L5C]|uniref:hypothetical protein n=1 Tax=Methylobacter sp. S3L5C TaxID=2839024 RepID=UPI001FADDB1A|nr:hypothetical protein [Methylobacter sp. S3L5C]UOA07466.1 hypothetical protein KKZ03_14475 [Methylobacter sp. S3L5C]
MRNKFLKPGFLVLALLSLSVNAEILDKEAIPSPIKDQFYKRHPNAMDISAEKKTHFKQALYEISFKEEKDKATMIELYRSNGHFFVNGDNVTTSNMMPSVGYDNLKAAFGTYTIKNATLVVNPNGIGEEYDLTVNASGNNWSVIVDHNGNITQKERD